MSDLSREQVLGRLANQMHNPKPDTTQLPTAYVRFAVVQSVSGSIAVIAFAGSSNASAHYLYGASFTTGNTVAVLQYEVPNEETCYLVLGKLA